MYARPLYIARRGNGMDHWRRGRIHERFGSGLRRNPKLVTQALRQQRIMPFRRTLIAGKQEASDQMPTVHLAQRIKLHEPSSVSCRGKMFASGILLLDETLQPMHEPAPKRLAAKERPIVELRRIARGEAREVVTSIG